MNLPPLTLPAVLEPVVPTPPSLLVNEGVLNGGEAAARTLPDARPIVSTWVAFRARTSACGDENGIGPRPWLGSDSIGIRLSRSESTGSVDPL